MNYKNHWIRKTLPRITELGLFRMFGYDVYEWPENEIRQKALDYFNNPNWGAPAYKIPNFGRIRVMAVRKWLGLSYEDVTQSGTVSRGTEKMIKLLESRGYKVSRQE